MWETAQTAGRSGETKEAAKALYILQSMCKNRNVRNKMIGARTCTIFCSVYFSLDYSHRKFCKLENRCTLKLPAPAVPLRTLVLIVV